MKPNELIEKYKCGINGNNRNGGYKTFAWYKDKDCVIAYIINDFGLCMLIKGDRKLFSFISLNEKFYFGGYGYYLMKFDTDLFSNFKDIVVVDEIEFNKYKDKMVLKKL